MKFKCGLTKAEIKAKHKKLVEEAARWKKVFAWSPVVVGDADCRWLEYVEVRQIYYEAEFINKRFRPSFWEAKQYRGIK